MLKLKYIISIMILASFSLLAKDVDLTQKPSPLPEVDFDFPDYDFETLDNGMKVFIIEDHEQPTVSFSLMLAGGSSVDDIPGTADLAAAMLTKGTKNYSALEIAQKMDGLGLNLSAAASGDAMYITSSGLKKHMGVMLDMMTEVLYNPTFPAEELEKLKKQTIASIKSSKGNSGSLAQKLARKVIYGDKHPYAVFATEDDVNNININTVKDYYTAVTVPNNSYMAIIGDINAEEVLPKLNEYFGSWAKGVAPQINIPASKMKPDGVYFVERPASVQSTVIVTAPGIPRNHKDYVGLSLVADVMGSGFSGRINRTLREKYAFTYGGYGSLTSSKYDNRVMFGADVSAEKTDSSIMVMNQMINELRTQPADKSELSRIQNYQVGSYLMAFENSSFIAGLIRSTDFHGIPIEEIKNYPENYMSFTPEQVKNIAAKYLKKDNLRIVVVGDPGLKEELSKYGKVYAYDTDIKPIKAAQKVDMTVEQLLAKYVEALGGESAINSIKSIVSNADITLSAGPQQMKGTAVEKIKSGNKKVEKVDLGMMKQASWMNGEKAWVSQNGQKQEVPASDIMSSKFDAELFSITKIDDYGFDPKITGKKGDHIIMQYVMPNGQTVQLYFNSNNFLLDKQVQLVNTPQGQMEAITEYKKYESINGVKFPTSVSSIPQPNVTVDMNIKYSINEQIDDSEFSPEG